ncbi:serine/threonine-protein kinase TBK1-like [Tropilaelaps mercedesae]|uniref:Serine/threonine-protein kinase TBK1-like n=1 Tax=Tropilaelaps mercedesae TaxID=418985 RepID=A0A1V9XL54_9ACAR|nr:serine/threonine-protein kinase TBK1-like [Tropilaelaps mercedesae]
MAYLRGSANYVWSTTCILGRGATATVYQGVNKKNGDPVAVKTFNKLSLDRPANVQMREFDVLRKVNHENIVKLIAIEDDLENSSKVLVMELCTGGSLFSILDDPMNSYGLEEDEFLLVLKDLTAGMKHLRDNNIIHRDLKPGNIMKYVAEDGRSIYKLTDFGAARELEDDQQFMSLYGTEEYLHPHMYERAVLRKPGDKLFGSNVDLWSIGVTLYHVSTGSLPFRPYGGRRNRDCMHFITTKKESGVISGVQKDHSTSSIEWGRDLPKTCLLSAGLKELFVPILAGVMECDSSRMWSFDRFFEEVTAILCCRRLHVFHVSECRELVLYIAKDGVEDMRPRMSDIAEQLSKQTNVSQKNQLVTFDKQLLESYLQRNGQLPATCVQRTAYLFNVEAKEVRLSSVQTVQSAKFPEFPSSGVNLDEDSSIAKTWCSITHVTKRLIERLLRCYNHLEKAPLELAAIIEERTGGLKAEFRFTKEAAYAMDRQLTRTAKSQAQICELTALVPTESPELDQLKRMVASKQPTAQRPMLDSLARAEREIDALEAKVLTPKSLSKQWTQRRAEVPPVDGCLETASSYVAKIRDNWQALARDQDRCLKPCHKLSQRLQTWYRESISAHRTGLQLKMALGSLTDMAAWYSQALKTDEEFDSIVGQFIATIKTFSKPPPQAPPQLVIQHTTPPPQALTEQIDILTPRGTKSGKVLLLKLEELRKEQNEILQIVEESQEIMYKVLQLSP